MKFNAGEIASVIQKEIEDFRGQIETADVGRVVEVGDGIARVYGLSSAMSGEMVEFANGVRGQVFNLEEASVGVIILGDYLEITEGMEVRSTGALLSVPVGEALLGRVVDPLGNPLDGKGPVMAQATRPLETHAPGVAQRQPVKQPLQTGIKAVDSMTPIGRGQRELIIGDRKTGKTAVALDAILNQKGGDVICIYGGGQRHVGRSRPAAIHRPLRRRRYRRILHVPGEAHVGGLRRPVKAGRRVPAVVAPDAAAPRPRGVPRRRVLLPQPVARTGSQAQR
jgi:F-type H+-transporting ATPase subunit alpha